MSKLVFAVKLGVYYILLIVAGFLLGYAWGWSIDKFADALMRVLKLEHYS